nr:hypothetical protein [Tanacetum cinerariifolium]
LRIVRNIPWLSGSTGTQSPGLRDRSAQRCIAPFECRGPDPSSGTIACRSRHGRQDRPGALSRQQSSCSLFRP